MPTTGPGGRRRTPPKARPATSTRAGANRRPSERRRTTGTALPPKPDPTGRTASRSRHGLTTRAAFLGLLVCALTLALTVPLREYVQQRGRVAELEARTRAQEARVAALREQQRRLDDPAYIEKLARERLTFVRPGEVPYIVLAPTPTPTAVPSSGDGAAPAEPDDSWYAQLWSTVEGADRMPAKRPSPSPSPDR